MMRPQMASIGGGQRPWGEPAPFLTWSVTPAKAGVQTNVGDLHKRRLDSRFRGNDGEWDDAAADGVDWGRAAAWGEPAPFLTWSVTPAKAGVQTNVGSSTNAVRIPAFAGMTGKLAGITGCGKDQASDVNIAQFASEAADFLAFRGHLPTARLLILEKHSRPEKPLYSASDSD